jgi:hypothetical protein
MSKYLAISADPVSCVVISVLSLMTGLSTGLLVDLFNAIDIYDFRSNFDILMQVPVLACVSLRFLNVLAERAVPNRVRSHVGGQLDSRTDT